jgi:hypothetical protein
MKNIYSMKNAFIAFFFLFSFTITSFKSADDTLCGINYNGVDSEGCSTQIVGTYDCNSANPMGTFTGTITFSGSGGCMNVELIASHARQSGNGWVVPAGYDIAFYSDSYNDFCNAGTLTFIGANTAAVTVLNRLEKSILAEFQSDLGC